MIRKLAFAFIFAGSFCFPKLAVAQPEPDDIAAVADQFQEHFYEALTQKGIENYDRALVALEKCLLLQPENAVVHFEIGKNALALKDYKKAYDSYEKATKIDPTNMWYYEGMYDVCYQTQDYLQAIVIVNKLIPFKKEFKEDLTSLYMSTQQFDKALELINQLNDQVGRTDQRDGYKAQILTNAKYQGSEKENLLALIKKEPKEESNYLSLIYLYAESNQEEKALEIAKQLEKEIPTSDWAQVSLFKFHLNNNDGDKAVTAMNMVFKSKKIDNKIKHRILNEFLIFVKDTPQYDNDLETAIAYFDSDKNIEISKEIGNFYFQKQDYIRAQKFYSAHLQNNPDDIETALLQLNLFEKMQQFDVMAKKSDILIESFPLQPELYYYSGLAYNNLGNFKKAKDYLETGLDYVVNNAKLESSLNYQLGFAYEKLGDLTKSKSYYAKAEKVAKK